MTTKSEYILTVRSEGGDEWYVYDDEGQAHTDFSKARRFKTLKRARNYFRFMMDYCIHSWFQEHSLDEIPPKVVAYIGEPTDKAETFQPTVRWVAKPNPKERCTDFKEFSREGGVRFGHEHVF